MPRSVRELRRANVSLSAEQLLVRSTFASFFENKCTPARVRAAEPLGFDRGLWEDLWETGAPIIGVPEDRGGGGGNLVDLALVAEEYGRRLAPVPFVEHAVAARLLAGVGAAPSSFVDTADVVAVALHPTDTPQLLPAGAIAAKVVTFGAGELAMLTLDAPLQTVPNLADAPLATLSPEEAGRRQLLAAGARAERAHARAVAEWKILTAAALVGLGQSVFELGVEYAKHRHAFGVPIGSFQAISHPLADVGVDLEGARNLVWKAAWTSEHDDRIASAATARAWIHAARTANRAGAVTIHTLGGVGITHESDAHLYFRRAKGWPLVAGDPTNELDRLVTVD